MPYFSETILLAVLYLIAVLGHSRKIRVARRLLTVSWNG
jgi:hypothetical protein